MHLSKHNALLILVNPDQWLVALGEDDSARPYVAGESHMVIAFSESFWPSERYHEEHGKCHRLLTDCTRSKSITLVAARTRAGCCSRQQLYCFRLNAAVYNSTYILVGRNCNAHVRQAQATDPRAATQRPHR